MNKINVAVVDDQNIFRQSLAMLISYTENFELLAECAGGQHFLNLLAKDKLPVQIAIIDMDMPGMNGIELNKFLQKQHPEIKVIVLSVHVNEILITQMINSGAASYLAKNCNKDELILAINTVYKTGFYFNKQALKAIRNSENHKANPQNLAAALPVTLSEREMIILRLICKEYSNSEIANELFISARTVEGHRTKIINKINCKNTAGMVLFAVKHGIFEITL